MRIRSLIASVMFLGAPLLVVDAANAQTKAAKPKAATKDQVLTYVNISVAAFCEARNQKVDFQKSINIAVSTQGYPVFSKHGGFIDGNPKPVKQKEFIGGAYVMIMSGALSLCPKSVPPAEKAKFEKAIEARKKAK